MPCAKVTGTQNASIYVPLGKMTKRGRGLKRQEEERKGAKSWQPPSSVTSWVFRPAACFCAGTEFTLRQGRLEAQDDWVFQLEESLGAPRPPSSRLFIAWNWALDLVDTQTSKWADCVHGYLQALTRPKMGRRTPHTKCTEILIQCLQFLLVRCSHVKEF